MPTLRGQIQKRDREAGIAQSENVSRPRIFTSENVLHDYNYNLVTTCP